MEKLYTAVVTATGGRDGHIKSNDGVIDLALQKPRAMGGDADSHANPELLFAGAYGACYLGALGSVGKKEGVDTTQATAEVHVSFNRESETSYALSAELHVHIPDLDLTEAQRLSDLAHKTCPYSKAIRGNVDVKVLAV